MTTTKVRDTVNQAWSALERIAYRDGHSRIFDELERQSLKAEKEHRAFGRRFTNGQAGYVVSAQVAARLIAAQKVLEQCTEPNAPSWSTAATIRYDVVLAYGLAEQLALSQDEVIKALSPLAAIDYAKDCAR